MTPSILVIDDQPENVRLLTDVLKPDYRVLVARSGERGLQVARATPAPDLILLDVNMPGMDGFEVLRHLKHEPATARIPTLFLTARDAPADEQRGLEMGAVDYLTKPVMPATVRARVRAQIDLKLARDRLEQHNRSLEAQVAERMLDNEAIQDVAIHALARLAETRDPETGNHLRRTQGYVRLLATLAAQRPSMSAELTPAVIELIVKSAPLHDIGKVGIPDAILLKPGALTADEWVVMRRHARIGAEAIAKAEADVPRALPFLRYAKQIAHHHHERWDGSGYPDGLAGEAIPLAARLMALADVFDALISRRVYKPAMGVDRARELIAAQRGRHFDPTLVDLFLQHESAFVEIAGRYPDDEADVEPRALRVA